MKCNVDGSECDHKIQSGEGGKPFAKRHLSGTSRKQPYPTQLTKCTFQV